MTTYDVIDGYYTYDNGELYNGEDPTLRHLNCVMPGWGGEVAEFWDRDWEDVVKDRKACEAKDVCDDPWTTHAERTGVDYYPADEAAWDRLKENDNLGFKNSRQYGAHDAKELLTVSNDDMKAWLPFYVAGISFPVYPQILVRFYTARSVKHLQWGMQLTHLSVFYLCLPAFLTGYTILSRDLDGLDRDTTDLAFSTIMNVGIAYNALFYITGCFTVSAAIAAYMSTADSALMAASSTVTMEWIRDYMFKKVDPTDREAVMAQDDTLYIIAKISSILFGAFAVATTQWEIALTDLYIVQGAILMIATPPYFFGMYTKKVNAMSINVGICMGVIVFVGLWGKDLPEVWATIASVGTTLLLTYTPGLNDFADNLYYRTILKQEYSGEPWDSKMYPSFLTCLTELPRSAVGYDIRAGGGPMFEPIRPWWINLIVFMCLFLAIPFWINLPSSYGEDSFSGAMPTWAVASTFFAALAMIINIFQTYYNWEDWISREGYENRHKIVLYDMGGKAATAESSKPTAVEMTAGDAETI